VSTLQAPEKGADLSDWLSWIEATHPNNIEMGLERAAEVSRRAGINPISPVLITVAGTNGKGSTVAMLQAIYQSAGYSTGVYTSPHIERFNERVAINGTFASDAVLIKAFQTIEEHRHNTPLTYFEFSTLAAMQVFLDESCEVIILEVGLGGRLDTTNIWDADCAIVTSIAIDHEAWLGSDRTSIGREKIGIGRPNRPLILGDQDPPPGVLSAIEKAGMQLQRVPPPPERATLTLGLPGAHQQDNAHAALMAVAAVNSERPVSLSGALQALEAVSVPGRFEQHRFKNFTVILDVAHNPAAALSVVAGFEERFPQAPVFALFGALNDKDVSGVVAAFGSLVRHWHCITLGGERGTTALVLREAVAAAGGVGTAHNSFAQAWDAVCQHASDYNSQHPPIESLVLVVGSFSTLTALHEHWQHVGRPS
jgi:dihydrofolate synthase / folylpolyglutamate synthase